MASEEKQDPKKLRKCPSDFVSNVPRVILNSRRKIEYEVVQMLGAGAFAKCFEVKKKLTSELYACKMYSKQLVNNHSEFKEMVENEFKIQSQLRHKNIVELIGKFEDARFVCIIQTLCSNYTLEQLIKRRGNVTIDECRYFIHQILQGGRYIHEKGIIHRDLKLANILLTHDAQIKICDFGLAIHVNDIHSTRSICGTKYYIAPEVTNKRGFVRRSYVWSIGVISFVLVFGIFPFREDYSFDTFNKKMNIESVNDDFRHFMRAVLETIVVKRPTCANCLTLDFFTKYTIPKTVSLEGTPKLSPVEESIISTNFSTGVDAFQLDILEELDVDYPEINVVVYPHIHQSVNYSEYAEELERAYEYLDSTCRHQQVRSFSDYFVSGDFDCKEPVYWVAKWSYDSVTKSEFTYLLSDGTFGSFLPGGHHFKRDPDNICWLLENGYSVFRRAKSEEEQQVQMIGNHASMTAYHPFRLISSRIMKRCSFVQDHKRSHS